MEPYQRTNMVIALLVYPDDRKKRDRLEGEFNQAVTTAMARGEDQKVASSLEVPPQASQADPLPSRVRNRLDNRLRVARMFRPFVREKLDGTKPALPPELMRFSINGLSRYVSQDDEHGAHNFERRWLKSTMPVLHLAIAFDLISTLRFGADRAIFFNVHDEEFIDAVIKTSVLLEPFVLDNPIHRADPTLFIRLRPD